MAPRAPKEGEPHAGEVLRGLGWKQGSLLGRDDCQHVLPEELFDEDVLFALLLNQDCDIVRDEGTEPALEFIPCRLLDKVNGNFLHGRNPRTFHIDVEGGRVAFSIDIRERCFISKEDVASLEPTPLTPALEPTTVSAITQWLGKRYTRSAFPDEFNRRWSSGAKKLDRLGKKQVSKPVTAVYVALEPADEELGDGEEYELYVYVAYRDDSKKGDVHAFFDKLCELIESCDGLDLDLGQCAVKNHFEITLADLEEMRRWDLDYRSIAADTDVVKADQGR